MKRRGLIKYDAPEPMDPEEVSEKKKELTDLYGDYKTQKFNI